MCPCYEGGAVVSANGGSAGHDSVVVGHFRIDGGGDGGDFQFAPPCPDIEGLNLLEDVLNAVTVYGDYLLGEGIEHEGIVCVGAVTDSEDLHGGAPLGVFQGVGGQDAAVGWATFSSN